jgi:hypothetical protein
MRWWMVPALAAAAGCAAEQARFKAAGDGRGTAYYYPIESGGRTWGDVKVWSPGSYELDDETPVVEVDFRIRGDADQALEFDVAATYAEIGTDGRFERVLADRTPGSAVRVEPGAVETVVLRFALPGKVGPRDVDEFEVNWVLRTPSGRLTYTSVFVPLRDERRVSYRPSMGWGLYFGHPYRYRHHLGTWDDPFFWP